MWSDCFVTHVPGRSPPKGGSPIPWPLPHWGKGCPHPRLEGDGACLAPWADLDREHANDLSAVGKNKAERARRLARRVGVGRVVFSKSSASDDFMTKASRPRQ